jgi:hypothetical protein
MLLNVNVINIRVTYREVALATVNGCQATIWASNSGKLIVQDNSANVLTWQLMWVLAMKNNRFRLLYIMPVTI